MGKEDDITSCYCFRGPNSLDLVVLKVVEHYSSLLQLLYGTIF
jgi:hypothetical protein